MSKLIKQSFLTSPKRSSFNDKTGKRQVLAEVSNTSRTGSQLHHPPRWWWRLALFLPLFLWPTATCPPSLEYQAKDHSLFVKCIHSFVHSFVRALYFWESDNCVTSGRFLAFSGQNEHPLHRAVARILWEVSYKVWKLFLEHSEHQCRYVIVFLNTNRTAN